MPNRLLSTGLSRVPGLKRLPVFRLLAIAEIAILAKTHIEKLTASERRRLLELVKKGRGRPKNLTSRERAELKKIVTKLEPRQFAGQSVDKLSPVPLPKRITGATR